MEKLLQKLNKNRNLWLWPVLLIVLSLPALFALLKPGYFSMHDDAQIIRLQQMEKCFFDGQIPCRWAPDMGAGYGQPLFNYYASSAYYLGIVFRLFSLDFVTITKLLFLLSLVGSGFFMYLLVKEFFGKSAGLVAGLFYIYAPYHAVDIYVRGALGESWAITFFPLIFFSLYKFIKEEKLKFFLVSIFGLIFLFLSHNIMAMIFTPVALVWSLYWLIIGKKLSLTPRTLLIFIWAVCLAAFFLLPAFGERSLVKVETLTSDYYNFRHHFVAVRQLFLDRAWGYGPSRLGREDNLSFQLGWPHWWLAAFSGLLVLYLFKQHKKKLFFASLFSFLLFWGSAFMTHAKSVYLWEAVPILSFVQFPWRFLGLTMFASSFLAGGITGWLKGKWERISLAVLIVLVILLNAGYFKPEKIFPRITDSQKLSGKEWETQSKAAILDYLPKQVSKIPEELAPSNPWVTEGEAKVTEYRKRSNFWRFTTDVYSQKPAKISVPVFDFPNWKILVDGRPTIYTSNNPSGIIQLEIPWGNHTVTGWFEDTKIRSISNLISLFSFAALVLFIIWQEKENEKMA